jgi:polar amino acid transport system substrate-binding protein
MDIRGLIRWFLIISLPVVLLAFTACGDDDGGNGGASPTATEDTGDGGGEIDISGVPELEDGTLTIGSDIAYAPIEYFEEGTDTPVGMDIDLATAMADLLGVDVEFDQVADFGGILGDLTTRRYDIIMSAISITPEREAEIDFVAYFGPVGTGILAPAGNPEGFAAIEDLCGKSVGAQAGTFQVEQMETLNSDTCSADSQIDIQTFPDNPAVVEELGLGRIDAALMDDPVAAYSEAQSEGGLIELVVPGFEAAPYGIGVRKESAELKGVLEEALQGIRDNGEYDRILEDWGQTQFALAE